MAVVGGASLGFLGVALTHICHEAGGGSMMKLESRQEAITYRWLLPTSLDDDDDDDDADRQHHHHHHHHHLQHEHD